MFTPRRAVVLLLIVTALVYAPTVTFPLVYEDFNDPAMFETPQWRRALADLPVKPARTLTTVSVGVNQELFGAINPVGFHVGSVALHVTNTALLAMALPLTWLSVCVVGVWGLHPLQVESVAYVSSRSDLLLITCVLLGIVAVQAQRWGVMGLCAVLAVLAKETGLVAGPLLAWYAWHRGLRPSRGALIGSAVLGGWVIWLFRAELSLNAWWTAQELTKAWRLALMVIWPVGFSIDHDWSWITPMLAGAVTLGTLVALTVAAVPPDRRWVFVAGWALLALSPRLLVPLIEGLHEHHMSLPLMGVALSLGLKPQGVS